MKLEQLNLEIMASRSTRNKIRHNVSTAIVNMEKAQNNLVGAAALADERSDYISDNLPVMVAAVDSVIDVLRAFEKGL